VREDYSADGDVWRSFPHDQARSRADRWGEDGLLGIADHQCRLAFSLALWNGRDPILKERLFGLANPEGNHGEDVKELYYYLDATPTASYLAACYRYPQQAFPYAELLAENARRGYADREYELLDTGVFAGDRFFDVRVEYAKASPTDICIRITAANAGPEAATLWLLPTLWFRNTWAWGAGPEAAWGEPRIMAAEGGVVAEYATLGRRVASIFLPDAAGRRPCHGEEARYAADPAWRDLVLFYEYFDGDTGRGCGAAHQTGWSALVANLLVEPAAGLDREA